MGKPKRPSIESQLRDTIKIPMEWVEAPAWKRIVAFVFDMFLILPITTWLGKMNPTWPAVVTFVYFIGFELSPWKGTIGKRMMSMKVLDDRSGKMNLVQIIIRYFSKVLSLAFLGVGYWPLLVGKKAMPDQISHTRIVALTPVKSPQKVK